jgi:hypothetical protein
MYTSLDTSSTTATLTSADSPVFDTGIELEGQEKPEIYVTMGYNCKHSLLLG